MAAQLDTGIEFTEDIPGHGPDAQKAFEVIYNARFFLRKGDEVTWDFQSIELYGDRLTTRAIAGVQLIDHTTILGKRRTIACVEKSLYGMQAGGYREFLASAHLCYGEAGIEGRIPPNAMLRVQLCVQHLRCVT